MNNTLRKGALIAIVIVIVAALIGIYFIVKPAPKIEYNGGDQELIVMEIKKSKCNQYKIVTPDKYDLPSLYHKKYLDYLINDPDKAWELVPSNIKRKYDNKKENYVKFYKELIDKSTLNSELERYSLDSKKTVEKMTTVDKSGIKIIFNVRGIWKFDAYVTGKVSNALPKPAKTVKKK